MVHFSVFSRRSFAADFEIGFPFRPRMGALAQRGNLQILRMAAVDC
jgi:hypothetical protein